MLDNMNQAPERKKNFSVSFRPKEISEVDEYVERLIAESGYKISRNEIIRRATLAHIRFMEENGIDYKEIFKGVGI